MTEEKINSFFPFKKSVITKNGLGRQLPNEFSNCKIRLHSKSPVSKSIVGYELNSDIEVTIGLGKTSVACTIDLCLQTMTGGETSVFIIPCNSGPSLESSSCISQIDIEITLVSFSSSEEVFQLTLNDKMNRAHLLKDIGVELYSSSNYEVSFYKFSRSLKYLLCIQDYEFENSESDPSVTDWKKLRCNCHLNLAACQLQVGNYVDASENCTRALEIDPKNVKGLFRRAQAFNKLGDSDRAQMDLVMALELEPNNKTVMKTLQETRAMLKKEDAKMGNALKQMFS